VSADDEDLHRLHSTTRGYDGAVIATTPATSVSAERPAALDAATLCEAFQRTAAARGNAPALRTHGDATTITWNAYAAHVERIAAGLARLGVERGDTVALMLRNRPEFNLVDTAALHLGAAPFSVYNTSPPEQIAHLLANAANRVVVTEPAFLPSIRQAIAIAPGVAQIVLVEGQEEGTMTLAALEESGASGFSLAEHARAVEPTDLATIIYTSGTTGPPKGVELTHANLMAECRATAQRLQIPPAGRGTSYLPAAHIADRWGSHYLGSICLGATITSVANPMDVVERLRDVRPTWWGSVPRLWEKLKAALEGAGIHDPAALGDGERAAVRERLGLDQVTSLVVGAAPTPVEVLEYFAALGLEIAELWGMSETSCCVTINPRGAIRFGTCGTVLEGTELELAADGELLVRGPLVMRGYRGDPGRTAEAIDADGWLHTGDVARIDADGYVTIVDRKKELIINSAGKNMSPANIESRLKASHPLVGQAMAVGDRRPYVTALLVLDPDAGTAYAREHGLRDATPAELAGNRLVRRELARAVAAANTHLARVEQVKRFTVLPAEWLPDSDELTPTMKLRRRRIEARYAAEIEALYAEPPAETVLSPDA
jgi:long-chain acyl-CoA synthetase